MTEAEQLKLVLKRSTQQMHISQPGSSGTDEGTGSKPGVLDVPTNESEEELLHNSFDDEGADDKGKDDDDEEDKGDNREEGKEDDDEEKDGDERDDDDNEDQEDDDEETRDEESFNPIPRTPEGSKDEGDGEEDQGLNVDEEEYVKEEEEDVLYKDVNINQGRGLQATLEVEDSYVTLTLVNPDGMESIFATTSSSVAPLPISTPTMTPSTIATITTTSQALIFPTPFPSKQISLLEQSPLFLGLSYHSSRTSYAVAVDLSEMELKKILIEKMEGNKSIQRSDAQRNLYKALVDAYESDKIILDTYGETVTLKRRCDDDEDKDEEPSLDQTRGQKDAEKASASESAFAEEPVQTTFQMEEPSHSEFETGADDQPIIQSSQHPEWFSQPQKPPTPDRNWNKTLPAPLPLIPDNRGRRVIPFAHFINNDLEYLQGGASSRKYTTSVMKTKAADYGHIKWIENLGRKRQQFYGFVVNRESARDVYSKRKIVAVMELKIVEWRSYKHLDWITDKKNRLMRIDELHKFSDGTLNNVRTALDDRLKGIMMWYLPQTIWRKSDKNKAAAMIQAIDKMLKTKRIMRSLERFIGGRLYEGDFRMLQRTI
nr:hypothetical protein [Tanacetum cinerariifolium]